MKHITRLTVLILIGLTLAGCAGDDDMDREIIAAQSRTERQAAARELYLEARETLEDGSYERAVEQYRTLQDTYPFTDYATQAQMEEAFAYFRNDEPELALAAANRFIKEHPRHPHVDYMYYLRGLVNFRRGTEGMRNFFSIDQAQRDQIHAQQAFDDFKLLIQRFPDSDYAGDARQRMVFLRNQMARSALFTADYYMRREAWIAANRRARRIIQQYQGTPAVREALLILEESFRKLGLDKPADDARATLVASYPRFAEEHPAEDDGP